VHGRVNVIRDAALIERLWKDAWKVWFPRGKSDSGIALLRFDAERGEFWNNAGMRGAQYAFQAAKAYVTGDPLRPGSDQHGRARY
jgi:general stress protein 26